MTGVLRRLVLLACVCVSALGVCACGWIKGMAMNSVAGSLTETGTVFSRDDDPELIRDAVPFALKLYESLLESLPKNRDLLVATCSGFTQYAYAFVQGEADAVESTDYERLARIDERAFRMYLRARGYCVRALELRHAGTEAALQRNTPGALAWAKKEDVPLLYWTGASWGSAIALGLDKPGLILDVPAMRALMTRALELDETYQNGAIHAVMITLESKPEMGGSREQARQHFARAVELSRGLDPGPYLTLATSVALPERNRDEFVKLLEQAIAIDPEKAPDNRLAILIAQSRARTLLARVDDLFPGKLLTRQELDHRPTHKGDLR
jgi:predicted anti-sigma-YlaC factor YlaD